MDMGKKLKLEPKQLQSILRIEGSGGLEFPYLGYVEVCLRIPEVKAFDQDVLLLIIPDSAHTQYTPITLGTLHIDMAIKSATEEELKTLSKQWQRILEGYFLQNRIIFDSVDKLSPVSNMAYSCLKKC